MTPKGRWIKSNSHMWVFVAPDGSTHARVYKTYIPSQYTWKWACWPEHIESGLKIFLTAAAAKRHAKERLAQLLSETEALR